MFKMQVRYLSVILLMVWSANIFCSLSVSIKPVQDDGMNKFLLLYKNLYCMNLSSSIITVTNEDDNAVSINHSMIIPPKPLSREEFLKLTTFSTRFTIPSAMLCGLLGAAAIVFGKRESDYMTRFMNGFQNIPQVVVIAPVWPYYVCGASLIVCGLVFALSYPTRLEANKVLGEFASHLMSESDVLTVEPHQKKSFLVIFKDCQPQNIEIVL